MNVLKIMISAIKEFAFQRYFIAETVGMKKTGLIIVLKNVIQRPVHTMHVKMNLKNNFTLTWLRNHRGHKIIRTETDVPEPSAYVTNKKVILHVICVDCSSTFAYDFVPQRKFYTNV